MTGDVPEGFFDGLFERIKGEGLTEGELVPLTVTGRSPATTIALDLARMHDEAAVLVLGADFADTELRVLAHFTGDEARAILDGSLNPYTAQPIENPMAEFKRDIRLMGETLIHKMAHEITLKALGPRDPKQPDWAARNQAPTSPRRSKRR